MNSHCFELEPTFSLFMWQLAPISAREVPFFLPSFLLSAVSSFSLHAALEKYSHQDSAVSMKTDVQNNETDRVQEQNHRYIVNWLSAKMPKQFSQRKNSFSMCGAETLMGGKMNVDFALCTNVTKNLS